MSLANGIESVSIYFYTGDFAEAYRRFHTGEAQVYATHDELCRLFDDLAKVGVKVSVYSFVSEAYSIERPNDWLTITSLGARKYNQNQILRQAIKADESAAIIPHFSNPVLIGAAIRRGARIAAITAGSFNRGTLRELIERTRLVRLYNNPRVEFVANHCIPSTLKFLQYGIDPAKLLAWDIPHKYTPSDFAPKTLAPSDRFQIAFAGVISEPKGVGDLIRAIGLLKGSGTRVQARIAGKGEIDLMSELAASLGISDQIEFLGLVPNDQVIQLFQTSHAVCVPSRHDFGEGFPLTLFEAIASRSPIICSDHPMFTPILRHGESACIFPSGDARELANQVHRLARDGKLYHQLSLSADLTWERLSHSADWRTLIYNWVTTGPDDSWIRSKVMANQDLTDYQS